MSDLTVIYYTSNTLPEKVADRIRSQLLYASNGFPIISVSQRPLEFGENICVGEIGASTYNLYKQVLLGAKAAKTEYVALCEDDCLYPISHFTFRPRPTDFAYNINRWQAWTWEKNPIFCWRHRYGLHQLICPRDMLVEYLEERFTKDCTEKEMNEHWGEPGRWIHDRYLGMERRSVSEWESVEPCIVFFHPYSLNYKLVGTRKGHGTKRAMELPLWGNAKDVIGRYWDGA
jgi:hypothetical protein